MFYAANDVQRSWPRGQFQRFVWWFELLMNLGSGLNVFTWHNNAAFDACKNRGPTRSGREPSEEYCSPFWPEPPEETYEKGIVHGKLLTLNGSNPFLRLCLWCRNQGGKSQIPTFSYLPTCKSTLDLFHNAWSMPVLRH